MNKLIIFVVLLLVVVIKAQETVVYAELMKKMLEEREKMKIKTSQTMSDVNEGNGFSNFILKMRKSNKYVKDLMVDINRLLNSNYMSQFSQELKNKLHDDYVDVSNCILTEKMDNLGFSMYFVNEKGFLELFMYSVQEDNIGYHVEEIVIVGNFTPSHPFVKISSRYSNMIKEEYSEEIKYLPAEFLTEHFDFIIKALNSILSFFDKGRFEPLLSENYHNEKEKTKREKIRYGDRGNDRRNNEEDDEHDERDERDDDKNSKHRFDKRNNDERTKKGDEHNFVKNEANFMKF